MKPLTPEEFEVLRAAQFDEFTQYEDETLATFVAQGLIWTRPDGDDEMEWTWFEPTDAGHRAYRIHLALLASVGGGK